MALFIYFITWGYVKTKQTNIQGVASYKLKIYTCTKKFCIFVVIIIYFTSVKIFSIYKVY